MILLSSLFYNSIVLPKLLKLLFSFVSWYQHFSFSGKISYCGDQTIWNFLEFFVSFLQIRKKCENFGNFTKLFGIAKLVGIFVENPSFDQFWLFFTVSWLQTHINQPQSEHATKCEWDKDLGWPLSSDALQKPWKLLYFIHSHPLL